MTMKVSKSLGSPMVALPGVGHMPGKGGDELEATQVFHVAAKRAIQRLVVAMGGDGERLNPTPNLSESILTKITLSNMPKPTKTI